MEHGSIGLLLAASGDRTRAASSRSMLTLQKTIADWFGDMPVARHAELVGPPGKGEGYGSRVRVA